MIWTREGIAARVDHAVLGPEASAGDLARAAGSCATRGVRGLCVLPRRIGEAIALLAGSHVRVVAAVGFPAGGSRADVVAHEASLAVGEGASEIDVVVPWGLLRDGSFREARSGLGLVVEASGPVPVKAIVEASEFDDDTLVRIAAEVVGPAGAAFLKTGTGVYGRSLAPERIRFLRRWIDPALRIKVSGGLRDAAAAVAALEAGADVLGMSRTFEILATLPADPGPG